MAYTAIFSASIESSSTSGGFSNLLQAGGLKQEVSTLQHFNLQLVGLTSEVEINPSFSKLRLLMVVADAPIQYSLNKDTTVTPAKDIWSAAGRCHLIQLGAGDDFTVSQLKLKYAPVLVTPPAAVNLEVLVAGA